MTADSESVAAIRPAEAPPLNDLAAVGLVVEHVRDPWALFGGFSLDDQLPQRRRTIFLE